METEDREAWKEGITKVQVKTFGGDRYVHYPDCNDDFLGIYTYKIIHFKHMQFIKSLVKMYMHINFAYKMILLN